MITLQDIADRAHVARSTVSVALRGQSNRSGTRVSAATRQRIIRIARELGYRPNLLARGLIGGRTLAVGLAASLAGQRKELIRALSVAFHQRGYTTMVIDHLSDQKVTHSALTDLLARRVDGVMFTDPVGTLIADDETRKLLSQFPAVTVVSSRQVLAPQDLVLYDRESAIRRVADHFVRTGRHRPCVVGHQQGNQAKFDVFCQQMASHGIAVSEAMIVDLPNVEERELLRATREVFSRKFGCLDLIPFDCLWSPSDYVAVAFVRWLQEKGIRVPEDVAVVGTGDNLICQYSDPHLASINRRETELAQVIESTLMARLANPDLPPQCHRVTSREFIWRESAGGHPPAGAPRAIA